MCMAASEGTNSSIRAYGFICHANPRSEARCAHLPPHFFFFLLGLRRTVYMVLHDVYHRTSPSIQLSIHPSRTTPSTPPVELITATHWLRLLLFGLHSAQKPPSTKREKRIGWAKGWNLTLNCHYRPRKAGSSPLFLLDSLISSNCFSHSHIYSSSRWSCKCWKSLGGIL